MPIFVMLTKLTGEGRHTVKKHPERIEEMIREVESMGVKVIAQYVLLGPYDFLNIVEAPDNETISRASVECGARGAIKIMTMPAITVDQLVREMARHETK